MKNKMFIKYYDTIMEDLDYNYWLDFTNKYLKDNYSLLDLGCGSGTFLIHLSKINLNLTGIDIEEYMIENAILKAKINHLNINFLKIDMLNYLNENSYNLITCYFDTINYLDNLEKINTFFFNCYKNLKNGGFLIFDCFTKINFLNSHNRKMKRKDEEIAYKWKIKLKKPNILIHNIKINKNKSEKYFEYYYDFDKLIPDYFILENKFENEERIFYVLKKEIK